MKRKFLIISTFAAALIILASIAPAVGSNTVNSEMKNRSSPLFKVRSRQSIEKKDVERIDATYIGEGNTNNLFPIKKTNINKIADKTIKIISENPKIIPIILGKIANIPEIASVLKANSINVKEFKNQVSYVLNNPEVLKEMIIEAPSSQENDPQPLGLSTSSALGCFIIVLIMAPLLALIGAIIATLTIITCILPNCFENLVGGLLEGFVQGLEPPEFN